MVNQIKTKIKVYKNCHVKLISYSNILDFEDKITGLNLSVTNAARVSFDSSSEVFTEKDGKLLKYLQKHGHTSPFRHSSISFEIQAPLMVARQWFKYRIGGRHGILSDPGDEDFDETFYGRNEVSRRYVENEPEYYVPETVYSKSVSNKQGSGGPVSIAIQDAFINDLTLHQALSNRLYESWIKKGVCAQQARLLLPAYGLQIRWIWTTSLQGLLHFLTQRLSDDAQDEIRAFATAVLTLSREVFPDIIATFEETLGE